MLLAQLEVVVEVARLGSLTQAAEALSLTQPAVSWRLRGLEAELGTQLFVRTRRGVRPTGAGMALLPHAQRSVDAARRAVRAAQDHRDGADSLVVAAVAGISLTVLPEAVRRLQGRHSEVRMTVHTALSETIADWVAQGVVMLGIAADIQHPDVESIELFRDRLTLVIASDAEHDGWTAEQLSARPYIEIAGAAHEQRRLRALLRQGGVATHQLIQIDTMHAGKELVTHGLGYAFLPRSHVAAELAAGSLVAIDLGGDRPPARTIVALRKIGAAPLQNPALLLVRNLRELGRAVVAAGPAPRRVLGRTATKT